MGLHATNIKKRVIEWGSAAGLNYGAEFLYDLLNEYCTEFYAGGEDAPSYGCTWEVDKDEFVNMLDKLKNMSDEEFAQHCKDDWDNTCIEDNETTRESIVRLFQTWVDESDPNCAWIYIGWL